MITPSLDGGGFGVHGGFADFRLISLAAFFLAIDGVHGKPCIPRIASAFAYPRLVRVRVPVRDFIGGIFRFSYATATHMVLSGEGR